MRWRGGADITWGGAIAVIFGLAGLAIAQPVLELFGRSPEFFVAGRYESEAILAFGLAVALGPPVLLSLAYTGVRWLRGALAHHLLHGLVAVLGGLFANVLARGLGADGNLLAGVAAVLGAAAALALFSWRPGRMLLQYLAVGNVMFLLGFMVMSPTSDLLLGQEAGDAGTVDVPALEGPVVVLVLDELPLTTLLRPDGSINAERYPAFAELAGTSTWFRNASSHSSLTTTSVPTILSGRRPAKGDLPTFEDQPRNLFTLLGKAVPVERYELVSDMCPADVCDPPPSQSLGQALGDAAVAYGHRVLPPAVREELPSIDQTWGGFGDVLGPEAEGVGAGSLVDGADPAITADDPFGRWRGTERQEKSATGQVAILAEQGSKISADPALHFIHVALPHGPWILSPAGTRLMEYPRRVKDPADPAFEWSARQQYQLQSMQTGAADVALGGVIEHLREVGAWDDALFVLVSDHGLGLLPPDFGRKPTPSNKEQLFRVPLFIKAPGQAAGEVRDDPAMLVDVLPSIIDLLDVTTDWAFEGHSLFDGSRPTVEPLVDTDVEAALDVVRRHFEQIPGADWVGLAAVGEHAELVGTPLDELALGPPSELTWRPDHEDAFDDLPDERGGAPQLLTGMLEGIGVAEAPELVVAVNGTIAGATGGYVPADGGVLFTSFLGPFLREGANEIRAFEVERRGQEILLRELA